MLCIRELRNWYKEFILFRINKLLSLRSCLHLIVCRIAPATHNFFRRSRSRWSFIVRRTPKFSPKNIALDILQSFMYALKVFVEASLFRYHMELWKIGILSFPQTHNRKHVFKSLYHKALLKHHHNVNKDLPSLQFPASVCGIRVPQ